MTSRILDGYWKYDFRFTKIQNEGKMINKIQLAYIRVRDFFIELSCKHEYEFIETSGALNPDEFDYSKVCLKCGKII